MDKADNAAGDTFLPQQVINGRYRIDRRIAQGGMATVYLATDLTLNRLVAVKVLPPSKATDDPGKLLDRFRLEAESLAHVANGLLGVVGRDLFGGRGLPVFLRRVCHSLPATRSRSALFGLLLVGLGGTGASLLAFRQSALSMRARNLTINR